jgi:hypothetical protein
MSDIPLSPEMPDVSESVKHFISECPQYAHERAQLVKTARRSAFNISFLLSDTTAIPHLLNFVNATKRFHASLGDISTKRQQPH